VIIKNIAKPAAQRTTCLFGYARNAQIKRATTSKNAKPLVNRWKNSIKVAA
jgi:hypothetical protein